MATATLENGIKELDLKGYRTKMYESGTGNLRGGRKFNRQYIYRILNNPLYLGHIVHKDKIYPGQHDAIFQVWCEVFKETKIAFANIKVCFIIYKSMFCMNKVKFGNGAY